MQRPPTRLEAALLEFQQAPLPRAGVLRRPAVLFASLREVLLLAGGRATEDGAAADPSVQRAACDFVRQALLFAQADHYQLLGLEPAAGAAQIKERYRLLMRLIHPDFSQAAPAAWPADAAVRVNLAYEALSNPGRRAAYDRLRETAAPAAEASPPAPRQPAPAPALRPSRRDPSRGTFLRLAAGFGVFGVGVVVLLALVGSFQERESIIQQEAAGPSRLAGAGNASGDAAATAVPPPMASFLRRLARASAAPASASASARSRPAIASGAAAVQEAAALAGPPLSPGLAHPSLPSPAGPLTVAAAAVPAHDTGRFAPAAPGLAAEGPPRSPAGSQGTLVVMPDPDGPLPAPLPVRVSPAPAATAISGTQGATAATPPAAAVRPSPSLAQVQPILLAVLHQMESADAERVMSRLDHDARSAASAQGFLRYFQAAVAGARSVSLAGVNLQAEPRDGRLLVSGSVRLQVHQAGGSSSARELPMIAEFSQRDGVVVLTGLSLGAGGR